MEDEGSVISAVEEFVRSRGTATTRDVVESLPGVNESAIRSALHRLEKSGRIIGVERGVYRLGNLGTPMPSRPPRKRRKKMTVEEYIANREDLTFVGVVQSEFGWEIVLRLDGSYSSEEVAQEQANFVSKTLGIPRNPQ